MGQIFELALFRIERIVSGLYLAQRLGTADDCLPGNFVYHCGRGRNSGRVLEAAPVIRRLDAAQFIAVDQHLEHSKHAALCARALSAFYFIRTHRPPSVISDFDLILVNLFHDIFRRAVRQERMGVLISVNVIDCKRSMI